MPWNMFDTKEKFNPIRGDDRQTKKQKKCHFRVSLVMILIRTTVKKVAENNNQSYLLS